MALVLNSEVQVATIVSAYPVTRRMFEALGIDYCCGGRRMLLEAAAEINMPVESLLAVLQATIEQAESAPRTERDWQQASLDDLMAHIISSHHTYLNTELSRLDGMMQKVRAVHGEAHGDVLNALADIFNGLKVELEAHLRKEEEVTFPAIARLVQGVCDPAVRTTIRELETEHDHAGEALAKMRDLTHGYETPEDACATYFGLFESLQALERDLHQHVHLENNILFPRALRMAATCERAA